MLAAHFTSDTVTGPESCTLHRVHCDQMDECTSLAFNAAHVRYKHRPLQPILSLSLSLSLSCPQLHTAACFLLPVHPAFISFRCVKQKCRKVPTKRRNLACRIPFVSLFISFCDDQFINPYTRTHARTHKVTEIICP